MVLSNYLFGDCIPPNTATFLYLIPIMLMQTIFALGVGVIFALFTPFFKDLKEVIPILTQLWFWATPIIYLTIWYR